MITTEQQEKYLETLGEIAKRIGKYPTLVPMKDGDTFILNKDEHRLIFHNEKEAGEKGHIIIEVTKND